MPGKVNLEPKAVGWAESVQRVPPNWNISLPGGLAVLGPILQASLFCLFREPLAPYLRSHRRYLISLKPPKSYLNCLPYIVLCFIFASPISPNRRVPMIRKVLLAALFVAASVAPSFGQDWASKMFKTADHDFGTVARGSKAEFDFTLTNLYKEDVHILAAYSSCGCTSVSVTRPTLKSWEEGSIHAVFNTPTFTGTRAATLTVIIDKPMQAEVLLHIRGVIRGDVIFEPGSIQLGKVDQGTEIERKVRVSRSGWGDWQVTGVTSSNPHISAKVSKSISQNGWSTAELAVKLDKDAPAGYIQDHLMLLTSEGQAVQMPLEIEGRIVSNLSVSPSTLFMGMVQPGQSVTKALVVKGNRPFKLVDIACDDKSFKFGELGKDAAVVHVIPVTFVAGNSEGKITKTIRITTDLGQSAPTVSAYAVISSQTAATEKERKSKISSFRDRGFRV